MCGVRRPHGHSFRFTWPVCRLRRLEVLVVVLVTAAAPRVVAVAARPAVAPTRQVDAHKHIVVT